MVENTLHSNGQAHLDRNDFVWWHMPHAIERKSRP